MTNLKSLAKKEKNVKRVLGNKMVFQTLITAIYLQNKTNPISYFDEL